MSALQLCFHPYLRGKSLPQFKELLADHQSAPDVIWFDTPTTEMTPELALQFVNLLKQHPKLIWNGSTASPFKRPPAWGRVTRQGDALFLHVINWPGDAKITLPVANLADQADQARLLADPAVRLTTVATAQGLSTEIHQEPEILRRWAAHPSAPSPRRMVDEGSGTALRVTT